MQLLKTGKEPYTASLICQTLKQKKEDLTLKLTPSLDSKLRFQELLMPTIVHAATNQRSYTKCVRAAGSLSSVTTIVEKDRRRCPSRSTVEKLPETERAEKPQGFYQIQ